MKLEAGVHAQLPAPTGALLAPLSTDVMGALMLGWLLHRLHQSSSSSSGSVQQWLGFFSRMGAAAGLRCAGGTQQACPGGSSNSSNSSCMWMSCMQSVAGQQCVLHLMLLGAVCGCTGVSALCAAASDAAIPADHHRLHAGC